MALPEREPILRDKPEMPASARPVQVAERKLGYLGTVCMLALSSVHHGTVGKSCVRAHLCAARICPTRVIASLSSFVACGSAATSSGCVTLKVSLSTVTVTMTCCEAASAMISAALATLFFVAPTKKIAKKIRDEAPKGVKSQIQGDELRVSSKSRDDLQSTMALLKGKDLDVALQFVNFR